MSAIRISKTMLLGLFCATLITAQTLVSFNTRNMEPLPGDQMIVIIAVKDVMDLDTYSLDVVYDETVLKLDQAAADAPISGITNILRMDQAKMVPIIKQTESRVNIVNTLSGSSVENAPDGDGVLGVLSFTVLKEQETILKLENVDMLLPNRQPIDEFETQNMIINGGVE